MSKSFYTPHDFNAINVLQQKKNVQVLSTGVTVGSSNSGDLNILNATAGSMIRLPAPVSGYDFRFIIANSSANVISAPSAIIYGSLSSGVYHTAGNLNAAGSTNISTTAGSAIGDVLSLVSDGTNYYLSGNVTNYNAVLFS